MGREKRNPIDIAADGTLSPPITGDSTDTALPPLPDSAYPADAEPIAPIRTRDRDPADRKAWKRERAAALGIPRD